VIVLNRADSERHLLTTITTRQAMFMGQNFTDRKTDRKLSYKCQIWRQERNRKTRNQLSHLPEEMA